MFRTTLSLERLRNPAVSILAAVALALAFPKAGAAWLAPIGAAALFWVLGRFSWKAAFGLGWLAGVVFFCISFSWWTHTIGHDVGPFWAGAAVFVSAAIDALAWGAAGALYAIALGRAPAPAAAVAGAAAFAVTDWLRSIGPGGIPFAQLGYTQAQTPLRVFAAYGGAFGVTFVLCAIGAFAADAIRRRRVAAAAIFAGVLAVAWCACWLAWPARHIPRPSIPVAAVQGNIVQTLKWQPGSLALAVQRYTTMTQRLMAFHPKLVVWPETVIAIQGEGLNDDPALESRFAALSRRLGATLVVGSIEVRDASAYNALFFYEPHAPRAIYEKRQLVPFAEDFPARRLFFWLPFVGSLNGGFSAGTSDGVFTTTTGLFAAPLICWESAFADRLHAQIARGAQFIIVSTDDAWFGRTSGPYQHAQISQLRAIENGEWLVRSAATGVSGIVAPDGTWQVRSTMDEQTAVTGFIGPPVGSLFSRIGPTPVVLAFAVLYALIAIPKWRRSR